MAYVLAGGRGSRLMELTDRRAKPAVFFGGKSRIIDFALSNALNSGIRRIGVATQYKAHSLIRHMQRGWNFFRVERNESFDILPASQRVSENTWYRGTADAVHQNADIIAGYGPKYIVILAGDHIYKMDYGKMLDVHIARGAVLTVGAIEIPTAESRRFGILQVDEDSRIVGFQEKPATAVPSPWNPDYALGSMGIYIFDTDVLVRELARDAEEGTTHDFGRDIIPKLVARGERVYAHLFWDENKKASKYWRDVGTLDAYYDASMDLIQIDPVFNLYDPEWPLRTYQPQFPPAKFVFDEAGRRGEATGSLVSMGCIVSGSKVQRSILSPNVRVHSYCDIQDSIVMPNSIVHRHSRLRKAIIDRNVELPAGSVVGYDRDEDRRRHTVSEGGVVVVTPGEDVYVDPHAAGQESA